MGATLSERVHISVENQVSKGAAADRGGLKIFLQPGCGGRNGAQIQQQDRRQTGDGDHETWQAFRRKWFVFAREARWNRSWVFILVSCGQRREKGLANPQSVSLVAARKLAAEAKVAFDEGRDPIAERVVARSATGNGGESSSRGFELSGIVHVARGFTVTANTSDSDARLDEMYQPLERPTATVCRILPNGRPLFGG